MSEQPANEAVSVGADVFRELVAHANDAVFVKDAYRRYSYCNPAMARMLNVPAEQLIGRTPEELFGEAGSQTIRDVDDRTFAGETVDEVRELVWGNRRHVYHTYQVPLRDADGRIHCICGYVRDITEQVEASEALKRSQAWMSAAIEAMPFAVFGIGRDGRYNLQNAHCRLLWGDIVGKRPADVAPDGDTARLWEASNARALAGESVHSDYEAMIDGHRHLVYNVLLPIEVDGRVDGVLGVNLDLAQLRSTHGSFEQYRTELETVVRMRTDALNRASLMLGQKLDECRRMEREVVEINGRERLAVATVLHDKLGQDLAAARYLAESVQRRLGQVEAGEDLGRAIHMVGSVIDQIRSLASGLAPVDLSEHGLASALDRLCRDTADLFSLDCVFRESVESPVREPVVANEVYHIAFEAIRNAVRHAHPRHVQVTLRTTPEEGVLTVEDDGVGFDDSAAGEKGLGLRLMRYRTEAVDGHLEICGREGGGTRVTCIFPMGLPREQAPGEEESPEAVS